MTTRHLAVTSPLGPIVLAADDQGLVGVWFEGQQHFPEWADLGEATDLDDSLLATAERQLDEYFAGDRTSFDLPLHRRGTDLQMQVWERLDTIPYGRTTTYGAIAAALGDPNLAQAVGGAVGHNPLSIVVPCHRVVGANGSLTGYAGGLDRKTALLRLEGILQGEPQTLFEMARG
ncbi:MAG: methylated-DNA--[protein]-cysteine S-methyltransferase [Microthrixaceae bacterium]